MVTAPEANVLLTLASQFDGREPDQYVTRAWAEALKDVDFTDAKQVMVDHYRREHWKITPSHIIAGVRALETERVANGPNLDELEPPERLTAMEDGPEFTAAYLDWYQEQRRRLRRGLPLEVGEPPALAERQWNALVS
jgi:hypothetical protein